MKSIEKVIKMIENDKEYKNNLEEYKYHSWDMYWDNLWDDGSLFHKFRDYLSYDFDMCGIRELSWKVDLSDKDDREMIKEELDDFNKICGTKYKIDDLLKEITAEINGINDYYNGNEFIIYEIESLGIDEFINIIVKKYSLEQKLISMNSFIKAVKEVLENE